MTPDEYLRKIKAIRSQNPKSRSQIKVISTQTKKPEDQIIYHKSAYLNKKAKLMKIGVLTGGGDAPGLNAALKAVVTKANEFGYEVIGIRRGWAGLLDLDTLPLNTDTVEEIHSRGGVLLYTSRTNPLKIEEGPAQAIKNMEKLKIDALIVMGGEDTLGVAQRLYEMGVSVVGIPKTIDNDLLGTDCSIGFDTAVAIATDAIDRLRTTAEAHHRIVVVEGARLLQDKEQLIVESQETDEFGHPRLGGISQVLEKLIQENTGFEARSMILGHLQRGGTPTAFDRILAM